MSTTQATRFSAARLQCTSINNVIANWVLLLAGSDILYSASAGSVFATTAAADCLLHPLSAGYEQPAASWTEPSVHAKALSCCGDHTLLLA